MIEMAEGSNVFVFLFIINFLPAKREDLGENCTGTRVKGQLPASTSMGLQVYEGIATRWHSAAKNQKGKSVSVSESAETEGVTWNVHGEPHLVTNEQGKIWPSMTRAHMHNALQHTSSS